jgi:hypothetical protein
LILEGLAPERPVSGRAAGRPSGLGVFTALVAGAMKGHQPGWLLRLGLRRHPLSHIPLQILFCTWLA